ncbi:MAG: ATP-dependent DNA helicase RecG [Succinivibrionaceae bacterium]
MVAQKIVINDTDLSKCSISLLKGFGDKTVDLLSKTGISNVFDLILKFPSDYKDRTKVTRIDLLQVGEEFTIFAKIINSSISTGKKSRITYLVSDGTGNINITLFNFSVYLVKKIQVGKSYFIFGKISFFNGNLQMSNPEFLENLDKSLTPCYSLTGTIKMNQMRRLINEGIEYSKKNGIEELLPLELNPYRITLIDAIYSIHFPELSCKDSMKNHNSVYHKRVAFEELVAYELSIMKFKQKQEQESSYKFKINKKIEREFFKRLPFEPTSSQIKAYNDICDDLQSGIPMNRLIQGDVGCGKTLVAILVILQALYNKVQVAFLVPTEILAEQHYSSIISLLPEYKDHITLLLGKHSLSQKKAILKSISTNEFSIVIGTHAIFQENVEYYNLGVVIIDEQHRFGVDQRSQLRNKSVFSPHVLSMTATPIPRTIAQTLYMDIKISTIKEKPKCRIPIKTLLVYEDSKSLLIDRIRVNCMEKKQVYWVCSLIEESDNLDCRSAVETYEYLSEQLPNIKIGLIHGKMKNQEKYKVMSEFKDGKIDILVATSVIEVGVDVPNAFLIVIENADRYGLAQLHQLRGRVGRGDKESYCCLLCNSNISDVAKKRLGIIKNTSDGFEIAQYDLELRGPGDILGTRQTGVLEFKAADIFRDSDILQLCQYTSKSILQNYPQIVDKIIDRWYSSSESVVNS